VIGTQLESYCAGVRDQAQDVALGRDSYVRECVLCGNPVRRLDRTCSECDTAPEQTQPPTLEQLRSWIAQGEGLLALNPDAPEPAVTALRARIEEWRGMAAVLRNLHRLRTTGAHGMAAIDHAEGCDCPACPGGGRARGAAEAARPGHERDGLPSQ
jgi:hypothetical protein